MHKVILVRLLNCKIRAVDSTCGHGLPPKKKKKIVKKRTQDRKTGSEVPLAGRAEPVGVFCFWGSFEVRSEMDLGP